VSSIIAFHLWPQMKDESHFGNFYYHVGNKIYSWKGIKMGEFPVHWLESCNVQCGDDSEMMIK